MSTFKRGDHVEWSTSQGATRGTVVGPVTHQKRVKGYTAEAAPGHPEVEVRSDNSGAHAVHKPEALRKVR